MGKIKEYEIQNFDASDIIQVKKIIDYLLNKIPKLKIKVFNELTGFYYEVNRKELMVELEKLVNQYTGIDEIILENDNNSSPFGIVFHERICTLELDLNLKKDLEKDLGIILIPSKKK